MIATYISATSFSVVGDKTATFLAGVRTRVDCGVDGYKYGTVVSRTYNGTITTVVVDGDSLTANVAGVDHGFSEPNAVAEHASTHGTGGRDALAPGDIGALPTSGGTMTGPIDLHGWKETVTALGSVSGSVSLDLSLGGKFTLTVAGITTISFANAPAAGKTLGIVIEMTNAGAYVFNLPTMLWPSGSPVTSWTASGLDSISIEVPGSGSPRVKAYQKDMK